MGRTQRVQCRKETMNAERTAMRLWRHQWNYNDFQLLAWWGRIEADHAENMCQSIWREDRGCVDDARCNVYKEVLYMSQQVSNLWKCCQNKKGSGKDHEKQEKFLPLLQERKVSPHLQGTSYWRCQQQEEGWNQKRNDDHSRRYANGGEKQMSIKEGHPKLRWDTTHV